MNELTVRRQMQLSFDEMTRAARAMAQSGYFEDASDVSKAMVKVLAGQEIGIGPFASMSGIHIIQGKPTMGANLIATLIKNDPRYDYRVETLNDKACVIEFYEDGEQVGESKFTMSDAKQAGIIKNNWNKYPRNMLFARAISNGARWYTPGIFSGATVYTPEEMGADVDEEGNVVTVEQPPEQVPTNGEQPAEQGEFDEIDEPSEDTRAAASPQAQAKRERPKPEPDGDGDNSELPRFWYNAADQIGYFTSGQHAKHAGDLIGVTVPETGEEAGTAIAKLKRYAQLRGDGVEQDEAKAIVVGEMGQPDDAETEAEAA